MKYYKTLLFVIIIFFSSLSFAYENDKNHYFKLIAGDSRIFPIKDHNGELKFSANNSSNLSPSFGIGGGYYINNHFRADLLIEYLNFHFNNDSSNFEQIEDEILTIGSKTIKRSAYGKTIILNVYANIFEKKQYRIFAGIGAGVAQIKEKILYLISGNSLGQGQVYTFPVIVEKFSSKTSNNFTHSFIIGTDIFINEELNFEISYSWRNFGKISYKEETPKSNRYRGHYLSLGLRYNL